MLRIFSLFFIISMAPHLKAGDIIAENQTFYYGAGFEAGEIQKMAQTFEPTTKMSSDALNPFFRGDFKKKLHHILRSYHISRAGDFDEIVEFCHIDDDDRCYNHLRLGYKTARRNLFGFLHLEGTSNSSYKIETHYCGEWYTNNDFPGGNSLGPMKIPSANIVNTEHTHPQSHFTNKFSKSLQKGDLHALFPTVSSVNSTRGNEPFGEVVEVINAPCAESALGNNKYHERVFEPAERVKGNVARAKFYFATRYDVKISEHEEEVLRAWHKQDPVDREEKERAQLIFEIQHVRNPYIDHPEWVDQVEDF